MRRAAELGLEVGTDVPADQVLAEAQEEMQGVLSHTLEGLQPAQLFDFLGEERTTAIAREFLRRRNGGAAATKAPPAPKPAAKPEAEPDLGSLSFMFQRNVKR